MVSQQLQIMLHPVRDGGLTYDPSERWVRATIGATTIVDSKRPLLLWEPGRPVATYLFPAADVRTDLLSTVSAPTDETRAGAVEWYDLELDGRRFEQLAWRYADGPLGGYIGVDWFARKRPGIEHWYEEEEEVFVHPRDPHKRVDAIPSTRHVQISIAGRILADTRQPVLLFETHLPVRYYVAPQDVDFSSLVESELRTRCPYKGIARYWSVADLPEGRNIVWAYEDPIPAAAAIKGHLSFYNELVDIIVDGVNLDRPVTHFNQRLADDAPDTTGVPSINDH